ncbi:MAG: transcriptional regulator NrdR [Candidatus Comchoanobacterales bacterium]
MWCPKCGYGETKVTDSRVLSSGTEVRRRRECLKCLMRFTTYERLEQQFPKVLKRQGYPVDFDEEKMRIGIQKAVEKRHVSVTEFEQMMSRIKQRILNDGDRVIESTVIGKMILNELKAIDLVAFIRYASVYFSVKDLDDLQGLINETMKEEI